MAARTGQSQPRPATPPVSLQGHQTGETGLPGLSWPPATEMPGLPSAAIILFKTTHVRTHMGI